VNDFCSQPYSRAVTVTPTIPEGYHWLSKRLVAIVEQHPSLIQNIIVQGSYGDFTNNNYSDLDIILFLEPSVVENQLKRQQLRRLIQKKLMDLIYSIDPLQHHGVFLLWPQLCDFYVESILPLVVYTRAWSVKKFQVNFRCTAEPTPRRTPGLRQTILSEFSKMGGRVNFYHLKRLTSHIMMVPCLYYMDQGIYLHKALSFGPFIQEHPKTEQLLADVTEIRNRWPNKPRSVLVLEANNIGYRVFGRHYPQICGALYRSTWIQHHIHGLTVDALSNVASLSKNAIS